MTRDFTQWPGCSFAKMLLASKAFLLKKITFSQPFQCRPDRAWNSVVLPLSTNTFVLDIGRLQQRELAHTNLKSPHYLASPALFGIWPCGCAHACHQFRCRCSALDQSRYLCRPTPWFPTIAVAACAAFPSHSFSTCTDAPHWEMAAKWLGGEEAEDAGGSEGTQGSRRE